LIFWFISMGHLFGKVLDLSERRLVFTWSLSEKRHPAAGPLKIPTVLS
jgi:hypothetical protein